MVSKFGGRSGAETERLLDKFSSFFSVFFCKGRVSGRIFRFSGVFCVDCALFRPKRPPGARFWAKTKFQKNLKTCLRRARLFPDSLDISSLFVLWFGGLILCFVND